MDTVSFEEPVMVVIAVERMALSVALNVTGAATWMVRFSISFMMHEVLASGAAISSLRVRMFFSAS